MSATVFYCGGHPQDYPLLFGWSQLAPYFIVIFFLLFLSCTMSSCLCKFNLYVSSHHVLSFQLLRSLRQSVAIVKILLTCLVFPCRSCRVYCSFVGHKHFIYSIITYVQIQKCWVARQQRNVTVTPSKKQWLANYIPGLNETNIC